MTSILESVLHRDLLFFDRIKLARRRWVGEFILVGRRGATAWTRKGRILKDACDTLISYSSEERSAHLLAGRLSGYWARVVEAVRGSLR